MEKTKNMQCENCGKKYEIYNPDDTASPDDDGGRDWEHCDDCGGGLTLDEF